MTRASEYEVLRKLRDWLENDSAGLYRQITIKSHCSGLRVTAQAGHRDVSFDTSSEYSLIKMIENVIDRADGFESKVISRAIEGATRELQSSEENSQRLRRSLAELEKKKEQICARDMEKILK